MKRFALLAPAMLLIAAADSASAGAIACNSDNGMQFRTWEFDSADSCGMGGGNPNSTADIELLGGMFDLTAPEVWTKRGDVTSGGDASAWLDVNLTSGAWGDKLVEATWTLAAGFWDTFGAAVFSVHVGGNPQQAPADFAAFYITQGQYSGTWSFAQTGANGGGGGLSNASIWTSGVAQTTVPEPESLLMLGLGLSALGLLRRRKS